MTGEARPTNRVYAELPDGTLLVPGQTSTCPGPDAYGVCPMAESGAPLPCADATWRYAGAQSWKFEVHAEPGVCPAMLLDPLGPIAMPQD